MKTKRLFFLMVIPLLLGVNLFCKSNELPEMNQWFQNVLSSLSVPGAEFPGLQHEQGDRSRSWRKIELMIQDVDGNGTLSNNHKESYFYNNANPARLDSMHIYLVDEYTNAWTYVATHINNYDSTGEYVVSRLITDYLINKTVDNLQYDDQNRLTGFDRYYFYTSGDSIRYLAMEYIYGPDRLNQMNMYSPWAYPSMSNTYERHVYSHDNQGRITSDTVFDSADSVSFNINRLIEMTYHADDISTGLDYIQYLSHNYRNDTFWQKEEYGKLTGIVTYQDSVSGVWTNIRRKIFNYNNDNNYVNKIDQIFNNAWINQYQYNYVYNADNYPVQINKRSWNNNTQEWQGVYLIMTYTWEQFTGNQDDVLPAVTLKLSAYPNPFSSNVNISLQSKFEAPVKTSVYNIKGQLIRSLGIKKETSITWDGKDNNNQSVSNGIYFIKAEQDGKAVTKKVIKIN